MAVTKDPHISSDRQKWNHIFNGLVRMLHMLQSQLKFVEDRLKLQQERWLSDVNLYQEKLAQMKRNIKVREMERTVESAKSELFLCFKQNESLKYKLNLENTQSELEDFKVWFDLLSRKCSEPKDIAKNAKEKGGESKSLEIEVRRLKHENEKLKTSEISALLSERDFVWNQYTMMESDLTDKLRNKHAEVEQTNEKIQQLLTGMEQLQASNTEKDDLIVNLKGNVAELESDSLKKNEEISRLIRELESLKKSRSDSVTPVLHRCTAEARKSQLGGKSSALHHGNITVKKELNSSQVIEKGSRNSKRKTVDSSSISGTPRLISSRFKVPKLKSSSPDVI